MTAFALLGVGFGVRYVNFWFGSFFVGFVWLGGWVLLSFVKLSLPGSTTTLNIVLSVASADIWLLSKVSFG